MAPKRRIAEEFVKKLSQVEALLGQGMAQIDAIREVRTTE